MKNLLRFGIRVMTGLIVVSISAKFATAQESEPSESQQPDIVIHVKGMMCDKCAYRMEKQLGKLESVGSVDVRLDDEEVFVTLVDDATFNEEVLREAVLDAGFDPVEVRYIAAEADAEEAESDPEGS